MNGYYDKLKEIYWNHLKLFNIIIAIISLLTIQLLLKFSFLSGLGSLISFDKKDIYMVIAPIAATLLGFIITSISIIITFTNSNKLELLKDAGYYEKLFQVYFDTIKALAVTTIISIIGIFYSKDIIWFYIILGSVIVSGLLFSASIWVLEMLIKIVKD